MRCKHTISGIKGWFSNQFVLILLIVVLSAISRGHSQAFSFAIVADPHLNGNVDHKAKLEAAVNWILNNKNSKNIELMFVLGDIAWGGFRENRNLKIAKRILDRLNNVGILYVPIIGDNEVHAGCEKEFQDVFEPQYAYLSKILKNWQKASASVNGMYLQNFSFDYKGCHFVCPDFNPRKAADEGGELYDFVNGSWPWLKNDIENCPKLKQENIVVMTHIGMFRTGFGLADQYLFSESEMNKIKKFLYNHREYIDSNYAGHIHQNWHAVVWSGLFTPVYHVRITDETWYDTKWPESNDQQLTIRWVEVNSGGLKIIYRQHIQNISR